ncbi:MAG TPA: hypothetical protein VN176_05335 [Verrucomicrobiae bacterium]|nr:hypothetical protein [Verrucomicrobiae bacterium]
MDLKKTIANHKENGVALLVAMMALLLLAAIGIGFMFMADTENSVNNNYRDSQKAYFASRAGLESVRALLAPTATYYNQAVALDMPSAGSTGYLYILNPAGTETVDPSVAGPYGDDELCQEQYGSGQGSAFTTTLTAPTAGVRCDPTQITITSGTNALTPSTSDIPYTGTAGALPFKWVRITNKQNYMGALAAATPSTPYAMDGTANYDFRVCFDGTNEVAIASGQQCEAQVPRMEPVWLLTSLATTPATGNNPGSRRITQAELANSPPINVPATVATEAPITLQGTSTTVNSFDYCSCNMSACTVSATTGSCPSLPGKTCNATHHAIYTQAGAVNPVTGAVTTPGVTVLGNPSAITPFGNNLLPATNSTGASVQGVTNFPYDVNQLISQFSSGATQAPFNSSCTGTLNLTTTPPSYLACGTQTSQTFGGYPTKYPALNPDGTANPLGGLLNPSTAVPQTTYVAGSVQLTSNATGAGVLIVDGDLNIHGGLNFYGLILVRGSVTFTGGGSSGTNLNGAILAGKDVIRPACSDPTGLTCDAGDSIGGNVKLQYDVCALSFTQSKGPPAVLATHELQY